MSCSPAQDSASGRRSALVIATLRSSTSMPDGAGFCASSGGGDVARPKSGYGRDVDSSQEVVASLQATAADEKKAKRAEQWTDLPRWTFRTGVAGQEELLGDVERRVGRRQRGELLGTERAHVDGDRTLSRHAGDGLEIAL